MRRSRSSSIANAVTELAGHLAHVAELARVTVGTDPRRAARYVLDAVAELRPQVAELRRLIRADSQ